MGELSAWPSLEEAIEYVAFQSEVAGGWATKTFVQNDTGQPAFTHAVAPDVLTELLQEGLGASLLALAIDAIQMAALNGKLRCRGTSPYKAAPTDIDPADWREVTISPDGQVSWTTRFRTAWDRVYVDGRQLRRLFPRTSGRRGVKAAEMQCAAWLTTLPPQPVLRKPDVWIAARARWGHKLSREGFDRAWKGSADPAWKKKGRRPRK